MVLPGRADAQDVTNRDVNIGLALNDISLYCVAEFERGASANAYGKMLRAGDRIVDAATDDPASYKDDLGQAIRLLNKCDPENAADLQVAFDTLPEVGATEDSTGTDSRSFGDRYASEQDCIDDGLLAASECERIYGDDSGISTGLIVAGAAGGVVILGGAGYLIGRRRSR